MKYVLSIQLFLLTVVLGIASGYTIEKMSLASKNPFLDNFQSSMQDSIPLKDRSWVVDYVDWSFPPNSGIRTYFFADTMTLFGGNIYNNLLYFTLKTPSIIESTNEYYRLDGKKLWLQTMNGDIQIENFTLNLKDTFDIQNYHGSSNFIVHEIDTVSFIDGKNRLKYGLRCAFSNFQGSDFYIIEGISSDRSLYNQLVPCSIAEPHWNRFIRCYYENEVLVYRSPDFVDCFTSSINDASINTITISPNPASNLINIKLSDDMILPLKYEIINVAGQRVQKGIQNSSEDLQIDVNEIQAGLYIVKFKDKERKAWRGKVVVE